MFLFVYVVSVFCLFVLMRKYFIDCLCFVFLGLNVVWYVMNVCVDDCVIFLCLFFCVLIVVCWLLCVDVVCVL